jgi:hypothetical protein
MNGEEQDRALQDVETAEGQIVRAITSLDSGFGCITRPDSLTPLLVMARLELYDACSALKRLRALIRGVAADVP